MKSNVIILDANFILLPFQFKIDYLKEIRNNVEGKLKFIVYQQILDELEAKEKRESRATKFKKLLSSGLLYLKNNENIHVIDYVNDIKGENENTDDFLLRKVIDLKGTFKSVFLATNDSELRNRSKKLSISVIFLRQKKYLSFERA
ncbi:hypothetical protein LCGC14_0596880 [marine sediment metagenome]|uniref:PIN domain-containing protein n=1 Tax=marine sediment metagenome TaxID=412755 RepID=A0A0F9RVK2_9ZZZZ